MKKLSKILGVSVFLLTLLYTLLFIFLDYKAHGEITYTFFVAMLCLCGVYFLGILIFYLCNHKKRDIIQVVEFESPDGLTPADVGYIIDANVDDKDVSALLVFWAGKKYLSIEDKGEDALIKKLKDSDDSMKSYEKTLFNAIFSAGEEVLVSNLPDILKNQAPTASREIQLENDEKYFNIPARDLSKSIMTSSSFLLGILTFFFTSSSSASEYWFIPLLILIGLSANFSSIANKMYVQNRKQAFGQYFGGIVVFLLIAVWNIFLCEPIMEIYILLGVASFVCLFSYILCPLMEMRNKEGRKMLGRILGLKKYIELAEKDKMDVLVKEDPKLFYKVLPYAYVLNVSDEWIEKLNFVKEINKNQKTKNAIATVAVASIVMNKTTKSVKGLMKGSAIAVLILNAIVNAKSGNIRKLKK